MMSLCVPLTTNATSSSKLPDLSSSSEDEIDSNQSDTECLEPNPAKKRLTVHEKHRKTVTSSRKYNKKWEESYKWLKFVMKISKEPSVRFEGRGEFLFKG